MADSWTYTPFFMTVNPHYKSVAPPTKGFSFQIKEGPPSLVMIYAILLLSIAFIFQGSEMAQHSCCNKQKVKRGLWSPEEDEKLINYITTYGHGCWSSVPKFAGLQRCGKSCRLRWINYLRPDLKRGSFTPKEAALVVELHKLLGNRWAQISKNLPGRTDNEVKNFWNSSIKKRFIAHQNHIHADHDVISPTFSPNLQNPCGSNFSENLYLMNLNNNPSPNSEIYRIRSPLVPSPPILQGFSPVHEPGFDFTMNYAEELAPLPPSYSIPTPWNSPISYQPVSWPMASNPQIFSQNQHRVLNQDDAFMFNFDNPVPVFADTNKFLNPSEEIMQAYIQDSSMADPMLPELDQTIAGNEFGIPFSSAAQEQVFEPVSEEIYQCDVNASLHHFDPIESLMEAFTSSAQPSAVYDAASTSSPPVSDLLPPLPCTGPFLVNPSVTAFLSSWDPSAIL